MAIMPDLKQAPTLQEVQQWVAEMKEANGFTPVDFRHEAALLIEEVGELMKAHRKSRKNALLTDEQHQKKDSIAEELADVLIYLMSLATLCDVDMETALRDKTEKNKKREWKNHA